MLSNPSANDFYHLEIGYVVVVSAARRYQALRLCSLVPQLTTSTILGLATWCLYRRLADTILKASGGWELMARVSEEVGV